MPDVNPILTDAFSKAGPSYRVQVLAQHMRERNYSPGMEGIIAPKCTLFGKLVTADEIYEAKILAWRT